MDQPFDMELPGTFGEKCTSIYTYLQATLAFLEDRKKWLPFKSPDLLRLFYCWGSLARKILFIFSADGLLPFQAGSEVGSQPRRGGGMTPLSTPAAAR